MKKLLVAMLLLYPLSAMATTYEWTDEQGTVHFAEDLGKVPKKFRKKARMIGDESGAPQTTVLPENGTAKKSKVQESEKGPTLYGGKDADAWRREFARARWEVQSCQSSISQLQGRLSDPSKMSRGEYLSIQNSIKNEEARLQGLQRKLDQLEESADRAGLPKDMRQ